MEFLWPNRPTYGSFLIITTYMAEKYWSTQPIPNRVMWNIGRTAFTGAWITGYIAPIPVNVTGRQVTNGSQKGPLTGVSGEYHRMIMAGYIIIIIHLIYWATISHQPWEQAIQTSSG